MFEKLSLLFNFLDKNSLEQEADLVSQLIKQAGILEDLIGQYPQFEEQLNTANQSVKPPHLKWVVQQLEKNEPLNEIINMINEFKKFSQRLEKKDLYQYKTLAELRAAIENLGESSTAKKKKERSQLEGQYQKIYDSSKFTVIQPHTQDASCYFGRGSRWCTAATTSRNYFNYYSGKNIFLYYILTKHPEEGSTLGKIAYAITKENGRSQIFDIEDTQITEFTVKSYLDSEFDAIKEAILSHLNSQTETAFMSSIKTMSFDKFKQLFEKIEDETEREEFAETYFKEHSSTGSSSSEFLKFFVLNGSRDIQDTILNQNVSNPEIIQYFFENCGTGIYKPFLMNSLETYDLDPRLMQYFGPDQVNFAFQKAVNNGFHSTAYYDENLEMMESILKSEFATQEILNLHLDLNNKDGNKLLKDNPEAFYSNLKVLAKNKNLSHRNVIKLIQNIKNINYQKSSSHNKINLLEIYDLLIQNNHNLPTSVVEEIYKSNAVPEYVIIKNNSVPASVLKDIIWKRIERKAGTFEEVLCHKNFPKEEFENLYEHLIKDDDKYSAETLAKDILTAYRDDEEKINEDIIKNLLLKYPKNSFSRELIIRTSTSPSLLRFIIQNFPEHKLIAQKRLIRIGGIAYE